MSDRPLQLGPDPNRSYLERWNELHPDRYGRADTYDEADGAWFQQNAEYGGSAHPATGSFLETILGLAILVLAPLSGAIATILLYPWTGPDHLTSGWVLGYAARTCSVSRPEMNNPMPLLSPGSRLRRLSCSRASELRGSSVL